MCLSSNNTMLTGEADMFYEACLRAADMYGQDLDKAKVNIAVGSLYTNVKVRTLL